MAPSHPLRSGRSETVSSDAVRWVFLREDRLLVPEEGPASLPTHAPEPVPRVFPLGRINGFDCRAAAVSPDQPPPPGFQWRRLRELLDQLPETEFQVAGTALHLFHWDRSHRFCPGCGAPLPPLSAETWTKSCPGCNTVHHPRIAPAIIVRVTRGNRILLARSARYPTRPIFSVIAGYVEAGETLEAAVQREIEEEVGLAVRNVRYFDSQPWPFSGALMVAFTADHADGNIIVDGREILEADWFSPDDLPPLPPPGSVSRRLIDQFVWTAP